MSDDIAERLRELANEIESSTTERPGVQFYGFEMEKEIDHNVSGADIYVDEQGDYWIEIDNPENALCTGSMHEEFIEALGGTIDE